MRSVRESTKEIIRLELAPMFKRHGFRKTGFNFWRRRGTVEHHFSVQLSQWNHGAIGHFYLNVGVRFDDLRQFRDRGAACDFSVRFEQIDPQMPRWVEIGETTDIESVSKWLADRVEASFVFPLDAVSSTQDFLATGWVEKEAWDFPAKLQYALGNKAEARRLVEDQAEAFADRGCTFSSLAHELHLSFD